jgi:hypothetical protein
MAAEAQNQVYVANVCVFPDSIIFRFYKLTLSDQAPRHCATEIQSFRFGVKIFNRSAFAFLGGGGGRTPVTAPRRSGWVISTQNGLILGTRF